jgi:hypothetical protein
LGWTLINQTDTTLGLASCIFSYKICSSHREVIISSDQDGSPRSWIIQIPVRICWAQPIPKSKISRCTACRHSVTCSDLTSGYAEVLLSPAATAAHMPTAPPPHAVQQQRVKSMENLAIAEGLSRQNAAVGRSLTCGGGSPRHLASLMRRFADAALAAN